MANHREEVADKSPSGRHVPPFDAGAVDEPLSGASRVGVTEREHYEQNGYVFLESVFSADEVDVIRLGIPELVNERSERVVFEADKRVVRTVYGFHQRRGPFAELSRHPRVLEAAKRILGGDVYVYQTKLNTKSAFDGDVWPWHQDYIYWQREDSMPNARALTAAVFLDDITELNGPMMLIPGSHRFGVLAFDTYDGNPPGYERDPNWIPSLTAKMKYTIQKSSLSDLARERGMVAPKGPRGSVLFFDCNVAHASPPNLSHQDRTIALVTYNRVDNAPPTSALHRPDFLVSRDVEPATPVADNVFRPAKA